MSLTEAEELVVLRWTLALLIVKLTKEQERYRLPPVKVSP